MSSARSTNSIDHDLRKYAGAAAAAAALFVVLTGIVFPLYFDLNDDSMMEMILSGAYTGEPASRNIQSYYPLSLLLSLFYRISRSVDWYGLFLVLLQGLSLGLVLYRSLVLLKEKKRVIRILIPALEVVGVFSFCGYYYAFYQYSVTVGILAVGAAFLFLTGDHVIPIIFVLVGFALRSEMMLLMLPFVGLCMVIRLGHELLQGIQTGEIMRTAGSAQEGKNRKNITCIRMFACRIALILSGMALLWGCNRLGYTDADWKEFTAFFDARTTLYDFQTIPPYEGNEEFYDACGISAQQVSLLENYNFGLDDELDAERMGLVADYASEKSFSEKNFSQRLSEAFWDYRHSLLSGTYAPQNLLLLLLYALLVITVIGSLFRRKREPAFVREAECVLLTALTLFAGRSMIWTYLFYCRRIPERLYAPMNLMEAMILGTLLYYLAAKIPAGKEKGADALIVKAAVILLSAAGVLTCIGMGLRMQAEEERRVQVNTENEAYLSYVCAHPDNFYFLDVYSSVTYSYKMLDGKERSLQQACVNQDLPGGWVCKSPLQREKLAAYGITSQAEALLSRDDVFFVAKTGKDTEWLSDFYASLGRHVIIEKTDNIGDTFTVYRVLEEP